MFEQGLVGFAQDLADVFAEIGGVAAEFFPEPHFVDALQEGEEWIAQFLFILLIPSGAGQLMTQRQHFPGEVFKLMAVHAGSQGSEEFLGNVRTLLGGLQHVVVEGEAFGGIGELRHGLGFQFRKHRTKRAGALDAQADHGAQAFLTRPAVPIRHRHPT